MIIVASDLCSLSVITIMIVLMPPCDSILCQALAIMGSQEAVQMTNYLGQRLVVKSPINS